MGYDNVNGYLKGGFASWKESGFDQSTIKNIEAVDFVAGIQNGSIEHPLDVRIPTEYEKAHVKNVPLYPLDKVHQHLPDLSPEKTYHVHCTGGYRSVIFASIAQANGVEQIINVAGGYGAIKKVLPPQLTQEN